MTEKLIFEKLSIGVRKRGFCKNFALIDSFEVKELEGKIQNQYQSIDYRQGYSLKQKI